MPRREKLLRWDVTPSEGIRIQKELARLVSRRWDGRTIGLVAGTDVHFPSRQTARATVVVLSFPGLEVRDSAVYEGSCTFPYVPGLLSLREIPVLLKAWSRLRHKPDLVLCDGQGIAHPRGFGLACHFGMAVSTPAFGCAKSPLYGAYEEPGQMRGDRTPLVGRNGETIGMVLRTREATRPLYVSVGHLIDLKTAVKVTLSCTPRFRIPEPLRCAHRLAAERK